MRDLSPDKPLHVANADPCCDAICLGKPVVDKNVEIHNEAKIRATTE
jgi:hypothetical protein